MHVYIVHLSSESNERFGKNSKFLYKYKHLLLFYKWMHKPFLKYFENLQIFGLLDIFSSTSLAGALKNLSRNLCLLLEVLHFLFALHV